MTFAFDSNDKFAFVSIVNVYSSLAANAEMQLADGTWVFDRIPLRLEDPWREWVGAIRFDNLKKANVVLLRRLRSTNPEVLDAEHEELARPAILLFTLLQLSGVLEYEGAHVLKGSVSRGVSEVRQMSELPRFRHTRGSSRLPVDIDRLQGAVRLKKGLEQIDAPPYAAKRVIRGLNVLMDGLKQRHGQERIHQFVRSLEGLILPETGKTRRQFAHRCQTFAKAGPEAKRILEEAFGMRSNTEHLNNWEQSLQAYAPDDREDVALHRTRQMERLACVAYSRILGDAAVRSWFEIEQKQREFWTGVDDAARRTVWGVPFDLASVKLVEECDGRDRAESP